MYLNPNQLLSPTDGIFGGPLDVARPGAHAYGKPGPCESSLLARTHVLFHELYGA